MKKTHYIIILLLILLDQLTKILLINKNIEIIPNFLSFTYTENTGAAFGIGSKNMVLLLSIVMLFIIIYIIIKEKNKIIMYSPFILIISGSLGNLIDRLFRGYVIDFININLFNFPNFNIADICILLGLLELIILYLFKKEKIFTN